VFETSNKLNKIWLKGVNSREETKTYLTY